MALIVRGKGEVVTYLQLCDRILRDGGEVPDFSGPHAYAWLEQRFAAIEPGDHWRFDEAGCHRGGDFRGREHSALTPYTRRGPHTLRAPTGTYDLLGNPLQSEGEVVIGSVYRFKGRAAPCVVLTEIDFEALDELAMRKLFVGATRATMKLILVVSERAAKALVARLERGR